MMKNKRLSWLLAAMILWSANAIGQIKKNNYSSMNVSVDGLAAGRKVYYAPIASYNEKRDSTITVAGGFAVNVPLENGKGDFFLFEMDSVGNFLERMSIYLEVGNIQIKAKQSNFRDAAYSGSRFAQEQQEFNNFSKDFVTQLLEQKKADKGSALVKKDSMSIMLKSLEPLVKQWVSENLNSSYSAALLSQYYFIGLPLVPKDTVVRYFEKISPQAKLNAPSERLQKKIAEDKAMAGITTPGKIAPKINQPDVNGKTITLEDFKGKYVLVDFWASWCVPCRKENPNVVAAYHKFKGRGFTVLGITLDNEAQKAAWLEAIKKDQLSWTQTGDLKGWKNDAAQAYGVHAIPANFLIGPDGKILARNLRGASLEETLNKLLPTATENEQPFTLSGDLGKLGETTTIYLGYMSGSSVITDSAKVIDGKFRFSGKISGITDAYLFLRSPAQAAGNFTVYLEPKDMRLVSRSGSMRDAYIEDSQVNDLNRIYLKALEPAMVKNKAADSIFLTKTPEQRKDPVYRQQMSEQRSKTQEELRAVNRSFYQKHYDSYIGLVAYMKTGLFDVDKNLEASSAEFSRFSAAVRATPLGKTMENQIRGANTTQQGMVAKDFTQNDTEGKPVRLSDFRGKYVLLDFWASWCLPCREENPNVKLAYEKYKDRNFTVLGVSLDKGNAKAAWLAAIKKDGLTWTNVSDLKYWNNEAAQLYGVKAIPANFLIDPNGKIVGRNLRGEALNQRLAELIGK